MKKRTIKFDATISVSGELEVDVFDDDEDAVEQTVGDLTDALEGAVSGVYGVINAVADMDYEEA